MTLGIRVGSQPQRDLGREPWEYVVAPHTVRFEKRIEGVLFTLTYEFGVRDVAVAVTVDLRNEGSVRRTIDVQTGMVLSLRSCQSYQKIDANRTRYEEQYGAVLAEFEDVRLARPTIFLQNVGASPVSWKIDRALVSEADTSHTPVASFTYKCDLDPGASFRITQVLGSSNEKESQRAVRRCFRGWKKELEEYAAQIRNARYRDAWFHSRDGWTDSSVSYARSLLAANRHYLDGAVVPMPCPAEYNFFFTHDVLLTDLSAVMFDPGRVKRDLLYILAHVENGDLPHAYYWKDDGFKTEYCSPGNWNNLWIILAAASYYRHTFDNETALGLYPVLSRSLEKTLTMRKGNVLHGVEPDWWDFGNAPGARAYLTILTIRALEEFVYLSSCLHKNLSRLDSLAQIARELQKGVETELWDDAKGYLFNTTPGGEDAHIYMGPLMASVYGVLPGEKSRRLVATAEMELLDPAVGLRTVSPADFHTDSVKSFFRVKSNEAGDAFLYANGGIWYLGNAWYARALRAIGNIEGSYDFFRRTMTLDGIMHSPRGQPALYEYRYADSSSKDHGRVDKPTMMWSAGFCVGTAYLLSGFHDNIWNVTVGDAAPSALQDVRASISFGGVKSIVRRGKGAMLTRLAVDGRDIPSRVLPLDAASGGSIEVEMGPIRYPFLDSVNAVLHTAQVDVQRRTMQAVLSSYDHHSTTVRVITPWYARSVLLNGNPWTRWRMTSTPLGTLVVEIQYEASMGEDTLRISF